MNYYEILNIARDADGNAIKRAYFSAVKSHPPESDPEGFKAIRTAYEILSSPGKRAEYDAHFAARGEVQNELLAAHELLQKNKYRQAIDYLTDLSAKNPDSADVKRLLADTLWFINKDAAAEKLCKELVKANPADCDTLMLLAKIAESRDRMSKAGEYYNDAVKAAPTNPKAWARYMNYAMQNNPERISGIFERAMEISRDMFAGQYVLYFIGAYESAFSSAKKLFPAEDPLQYFNKFAEYFINDKNHEKEIYKTVISVMPRVAENDKFIPFVEKVLPALEHSSHRDEQNEDDFRYIQSHVTIHKLHTDDRIDDALVALTGFLLEEDDADRNEIRTIECYIVANLPAFRPPIRVLRNEYPDCFKLNQSFYQDALNEKKAEFLQDKYFAIYKKLKPLTNADPDGGEFYDDSANAEEVKTFVRESPKIGRNDPCPCGSGKKYKKCCGAEM